MSCCGLLIKVGFLSFLALNAWNILHNSDTHTTQFKTNYKSFETTVHSRLGLKLPDCWFWPYYTAYCCCCRCSWSPILAV